MSPGDAINKMQTDRDPEHDDAGLEVQGALQAMRRAGKRAQSLALQTGTKLVLMRSGQIVRVSPENGSLAEPRRG